MTKFALLIAMILISFHGMSQYEDEIGFTSKIDTETLLGDFVVDAPKEKLLKFLKMDSEFLEDEFITSSYDVDFNKAGLTSYFGLKIIDMWVDFDGERDSNGIPMNEDVFSVGVRLELPKSDEERSNFMNEIMDFYGEAEPMYDPSYSTMVRLFWWSEITMLSVELGVDIETGEDFDYFEVRFDQAYGG